MTARQQYEKGLAHGIILAASICVKAHGQEVVAEEILRAAGLTTRKEAKAAGATDYDLKILRPVFLHMKP